MSNKKNSTKNANDSNHEDLTSDFSTDGSDISVDGFETPNNGSKVSPIQAAAEDSSIEQELEKAKQDLLYLHAEFENFKKRSYKERTDLIKYGPERLAIEVLSVVDIFDMALSHEVSAEMLDSFKEGMDMTYTQLISSLKKFGVEEISTLGEPFDPNIHEALSNQPTDEYPPDHVCLVFKKGYKFFDKVIRPAQVVVSKPLESE